MVVDMVEGIMVARMGEDARFTKNERDMIEPNAAAILKKMSPKTASNIAKFSEPVAVAAGIFMYAMRVSSISAKRDADRDGIALNRAQPVRPGTANTRPAGTVVPSAQTPRANTNGHAPIVVGPVQNIPPGGLASRERQDVPKDGTGKVDPSLSADWGS